MVVNIASPSESHQYVHLCKDFSSRLHRTMVLILDATTFYHQHLCANATPYKMCTNGQQ